MKKKKKKKKKNTIISYPEQLAAVAHALTLSQSPPKRNLLGIRVISVVISWSLVKSDNTDMLSPHV